MMLHTILFAAAAASVEIRGGVAAATAATAATTRCESDLDCQLNGAASRNWADGTICCWHCFKYPSGR